MLGRLSAIFNSENIFFQLAAYMCLGVFLMNAQSCEEACENRPINDFGDSNNLAKGMLFRTVFHIP